MEMGAGGQSFPIEGVAVTGTQHQAPGGGQMEGVPRQDFTDIRNVDNKGQDPDKAYGNTIN